MLRTGSDWLTRPVCLQALCGHGGYDELAYIQSFQHWFDFGGCWQGYVDHPTKDTLLNLHRRKANDEAPNACGADDTQNPALTKLPPLLAAHYQDPDLMTNVVSAVRVTNNNDTAVAYAKAAALMLQSAITGSSPKECVKGANLLMPRPWQLLKKPSQWLSRTP